MWDLSDESSRIVVDDTEHLENEKEHVDEKPAEGQPPPVTEEVHDKSSQSIVSMKYVIISNIMFSHKSHVNDIKFVPRGIKVDKKKPSEGEITHFISCAEDGFILIWDTRPVLRENRKGTSEDVYWKPQITIPLYKADGTGEQGLSCILFDRTSLLPQFWAGSDEGDLIFIDWSKRPTGKEDDNSKMQDFMQTRDNQRNYRKISAIEQSPFFEDLIMTVHDFNFCIWKIDLADYLDPIFISSYTQGAYNT